MQRTMWTDERIDDLVDRLDKTTQRLEKSIDDLRFEMTRGFARCDEQFLGLRGQMATMNRQLTAAALGLFAALIGLVLSAAL